MTALAGWKNFYLIVASSAGALIRLHLLYAFHIGAELVVVPARILEQWAKEGMPLPGEHFTHQPVGAEIPYEDLDLERPLFRDKPAGIFLELANDSLGDSCLPNAWPAGQQEILCVRRHAVFTERRRLIFCQDTTNPSHTPLRLPTSGRRFSGGPGALNLSTQRA